MGSNSNNEEKSSPGICDGIVAERLQNAGHNRRRLFKERTLALTVDVNAVTHGIQLALAPVFLLTAVSGMIAAVAGRLARIIDRARVVEDKARAGKEDAELLRRSYEELAQLRLRGRLANGCIALLTTCAFLIGLTIILLFLGETTSFRSNWSAVISFLLGVGTFLLALLCFLWETVEATRLLNFHLLR